MQHDVRKDFELKRVSTKRLDADELKELCSEYRFAIPYSGVLFTPIDSRAARDGEYWFIKPRVRRLREIFKLMFVVDEGHFDPRPTTLSRTDIYDAYEDLVRSDRNPHRRQRLSPWMIADTFEYYDYLEKEGSL